MQYRSYRLGSQFVARSRFGLLKLSVTESVWVPVAASYSSTSATLFLNSSALLGPSLDKFEKIRIKVGLVLVAICDKTEYTN